MNTFLSKSKTFDKTCFLVGDLNLNLIDYQSDAKVRDFVNLIFQYSWVPTVNKPSRVTKNNATLIDYIISNSINDQENLTGILKTNIFWSFSNFYCFYETDLILATKKVTIRKRERESERESDKCRLDSRIQIFYLKWIAGTCIQYLTPTMATNISWKFS